MKNNALNSWNVTPKEAIKIQRELASKIKLTPLTKTPRIVAACDISFNRYGKFLYGAVVAVSIERLELLETVSGAFEARFPYVPGLLSFREAPPIIELLGRLKTRFDVLLIDGQGIAHPRRFGIASHIGAALDTPAIGCAKSLLIGEYAEPAPARGSRSPLVEGEETIGAAVRTREGVKPVFVSCGHKILLEEAIELALKLSPKYRIPEPLREAHKLCNEARRAELNGE